MTKYLLTFSRIVITYSKALKRGVFQRTHYLDSTKYLNVAVKAECLKNTPIPEPKRIQKGIFFRACEEDPSNNQRRGLPAQPSKTDKSQRT